MNLLEQLIMPKHSYSASIKGEEIYLPFLKQINPLILRIRNCVVNDSFIILDSVYKNGNVKKITIDRITSEISYSTKQGKFTHYMLPYLSDLNRSYRFLEQFENEPLNSEKNILQYTKEHPTNEFVEIISKIHPNFKGCIRTDWNKDNLILYDATEYNRIYCGKVLQNQMFDVYTNFFEQEKYSEEIKNGLKRHIFIKSHEKMNDFNKILIQNYTFNIQHNVQNNFPNESICENSINSHDISKKFFKLYENDFGFNDSNFYKYNSKNDSYPGLWSSFDFDDFIQLTVSKEDEYAIKFSKEEIKFMNNNKKNIYTNIKGMFKKNCIEFDVFPYLIPFIDSKGGKLLDLKQKCFIEPNQSFYCKTTTNWSYNEQQSKQYYFEVEEFLNKIFPIKEIQEFVLAYIYKTLMGDKLKMFLILTDDLNGNNGKSTFINFISECFGSDFVCPGKKYLIKSNVTFNSNNHDAGIYNLKNKRFLIVSECSETSKIDDEFIKELADNVNSIRGRKFQSGSDFEFKLYANTILACNNNSFYKFNTTDENIIKRMFVVQMQSKFDINCQQDDWENLYFRRENLTNKFPLWKSSFIDILLKIGNRLEEIVLKLETNQQLKEWRNLLLSKRVGIDEDNSNDFEKWFKKNLEYTENSSEWISCVDLKKKLLTTEFESFVRRHNYINVLKCWLNQLKVDIIFRFYYYNNVGKRCERKNVVKYYKIKSLT